MCGAPSLKIQAGGDGDGDGDSDDGDRGVVGEATAHSELL